MKTPNVSMEEIINYAHIGGHTGKLDKYSLELPDDMHCYSEFLYFLENNLTGLNGTNSVGFEKAKKMKGAECSAYLQGRVDQIMDEIMRTCFTDKAIKDKKIEIPRDSLLSKSSLSAFVINYILRLNGYKIDGDYTNTKDLSQLKSTYSIKRSTPALDEKIVKKNFETLSEKSPVDFYSNFKQYINNQSGKQK